MHSPRYEGAALGWEEESVSEPGWRQILPQKEGLQTVLLFPQLPEKRSPPERAAVQVLEPVLASGLVSESALAWVPVQASGLVSELA